MLKNYILTALRAIKKQKFFAIINILGLTVGIAASMYIGLYVYDELSYDKFHKDADKIYHIGLNAKIAGQSVRTTATPARLAAAIREEVAAVEDATVFQEWQDIIFRQGDKILIEEKVLIVDSSFLKIFTFPLVEGDISTALTEPNSVIITEEMAKKYFGDSSPIGKDLIFGKEKKALKVTGLAKNPPNNSNIQYTALISIYTYPDVIESHWMNNSYHNYYKITKGSTPADVDEQVDVVVDKYVSPILKQLMGSSLKEMRDQGGVFDYFSEPMLDIHLGSSMDDNLTPPTNIAYIYILVAIGLFILIIACINFMNLSTAKASKRAKEIGLRKTMGSTRNQLISQFLIESVIYSLFATLLAVLMVYLFLPSLNVISGKTLLMDVFFQPSFILMAVIIVLFVGLMAGSYPAFYLTSFEVTEVLKGKLKTGMKSGRVRSVLVIFQFWISITLIICTAIVYGQITYVQNKDLGLEKDNVVYIDGGALKTNAKAYKDKLETFDEIEITSFTNNSFPNINNNSLYRNAGTEEDHILANYRSDYDQLKAIGFQLKEGRFFSKEFPSDSTAVIINEATAIELGWDKPLEEMLSRPMNDNGKFENLKVVGVIKDFNFESLKDKVRPMVIHLGNQDNMSMLAVRFKGNEYKEVLKIAESEWKEYAPSEPFEYTFLSDEYDELFRAEQRLGLLFAIFTGLAIFIACLGLFGLTAFSAEQRTKEIGIRKALGASVWEINKLLTREFTKLVLLAFAIAIYPAYYMMSNWLNNFAYRTEISIWIFAIAGVMALIIAWLTVTFQSQKVARANPINALKYE